MRKVLFLAFVGIVLAGVPRLISYQGRLTDSDGNPLTGTHTVSFRLYKVASGGSPIWSETHSVSLSEDGLYDVMLGSVNPFPDSVDFSEWYWLSVSVDGGAELCRYQLGAAPYALNLASLGAADGQMLVWNGTKWQPQTISTDDNDWNRVGDSLFSLPDSTISIKGGKVGIGTSNPAAQLQVNGDIIQKGPWIDVRAYGAFPDDGVDDAAAIQNALDDAGASEVFLPAGTYNLSAPIQVPAHGTLRGQGYYSTVLLYNGPGDTAAVVLGYGATVRDMMVKSSRSSWNVSHPITGILVPTSEAMIENVTVYNFEKGIFLLGAGRGCAYNYIQPRLMANNYYGIYLDAVDGGWVNENIIVGGRWTIWSDRATVGTWGVYITSHTSNVPNNNKFIGLSIEGYDYAIRLSGVYNTFVDPRIEIPSDLGTKARVVYRDLPSSPCKYNYFFGAYAYYTFGTSEDSFYFVHYDVDSNYVPYDRNLVMMVRSNSEMPFNFLTNAVDFSGLSPWRKAYIRYNVDDDQMEVEIGGRNIMTLRHYAGRVGVGTTTPECTFQVGNYGDGTVAMANAWLTFSRLRLMDRLEHIDSPLDKISHINGYYFHWRDASDTSRQIGLVAEEVKEVLPEAVYTDEKGEDAVDYSKLVPLLLEAVKSLKTQNDSLSREILNLKNKIN